MADAAAPHDTPRVSNIMDVTADVYINAVSLSWPTNWPSVDRGRWFFAMRRHAFLKTLETL